MLSIVIEGCNTGTQMTPPGGYQYRKPLTWFDSVNYIFPLKNLPPDSTALKNSMLIMKAFDEPNISLVGSENPIIRLVVQISNKNTLIIRIDRNRVIRKTYKSGTIFPSLELDSLNKEELRHYYVLRYNLGMALKNRISENTKRYNDSVTKLLPKLKSKSYYDYLVGKATVKADLKYQLDTFMFPARELRALMDSISHSGFWSLAPFDTTVCEDSYHNGGYYLEVNTRYRYSFVQQTYGCQDRMRFRQLCKFILTLAKVDSDYQL
jgi:hypothetical protein